MKPEQPKENAATLLFHFGGYGCLCSSSLSLNERPQGRPGEASRSGERKIPRLNRRKMTSHTAVHTSFVGEKKGGGNERSMGAAETLPEKEEEEIPKPARGLNQSRSNDKNSLEGSYSSSSSHIKDERGLFRLRTFST